MNSSLISLVFQYSQQRGTTLALLAALAHTSNEDGIAAPTLSKLATMLNINKRNVSRNLAILKDAGEISLKGRTKRGVNTYEICLDIPEGV